MKPVYDPSLALEHALRDMFLVKSWTFVSFVHIDAAVSTLAPGSRVMSIGGGRTLSCDRMLALRYPWVSFTGTDLLKPRIAPEVTPANLTAQSLDICAQRGDESCDLVYSVECFEHIEDDDLAVRNALSFVRKGGSFLVIVPIATIEDQHDPQQVERDRSLYRHQRVGYHPERLTQLVEPGRFRTVELENCYWRTTMDLRNYRDEVLPQLTPTDFRHLEALARLDLRPGELVPDRSKAVGLKLLATGKGQAAAR